MSEVTHAQPTRGRRRVVLAICCMSLLIVSLDDTALNVALPALRRDLGASVSGLQWPAERTAGLLEGTACSQAAAKAPSS